MSNRVLGVLQIFPNKDEPDIKAVFNLKQGDNFVGSSPFCEVIFPQDDIEAVHCKISLNDDGEYFIEDVGSSSGVFRSGSDGGLQRLRIHKEYELPINKAFYLGTKYKCLFMPKLAKSMAEPESRSPQKPYSLAYNGGNIAKTQEVTTLQIPSLQHEMDEIGYPSQTQTPSQSDAPSRPKTKLTGHLASLVHTADFRNSLDEYSDPKFTQEGGTLSQNESDAGYGGLTMKAFRPKKSPNKSADKDVMPSLVPAGYEEEEEFQRPEEVVTPYKAETKKTKAKQKEEDDNVGLSLIARKGKNQLDNMSEEEEDNEEVEQQQVSFRKSSKNNSPGEDNSVLSSTRNTLLARQDKEDSNDSTFIKSFKNKKSEPEKVVEKMLGQYSNGRKSSDGSEEREESREQSQEEPREEKKAKEAKEEVHDAGTVKHFKKKGGLMGTMLGLMKNKNGGRMEDEEDDNEVLRPDMSQDIGGKTIAQQKKEQERKREEEQRRKEQEKKEKEEEQQRRRELEKKKEEEQRRKEQEKKKEEEHRKKEEQKRKEEEQRRKKEEEQQRIAKKKEEEQRAAAKKEEDEQLRGSREMRKSGQTKKEEDESNKLKKEAKQEEDEEKGRKGRATRGNGRGNTKKEKEESPMEIVTRKDELKREDSEEREYDDGDDGSGDSLDGLPFRKSSKLRDEDKEKGNTPPKKSMEEEERRTSTRRGRKKSEADEEEETTPKKKVVGKRGGKKSAEKEKEIEVEKKKGRGGKKGKEEMEVEEEADDKKRKKRAASGKKGKKLDEEDSLMARLLRRQNEMAEMLKPYSDSDEDEEEESPKFVKGKKKVNERGKVKEEPKELKKKGKVDEEEEKPKPKRGKKSADSPKKTKESEEKMTTRSTRSKGKAADKQEKKAQAKNKKQISDEEEDEEEEEEEMNTSMRRSSRTSAKAKAEPPKKESPKKNTRTKSMEESDSKGRKKVKTEAGSDMKKSMSQSQKSAAAKKTAKKKEVMEEEETSDLDELNLPKRNAYRVIFSGFEPNDGRVDDAKRDLESIGVKVFEDKERDFNVLVMERFKRTIKFLLAVSRGVSIVSFKWVKDSLEEGQALPPEDYVYADKGAESKFKFKLSTTLQKAKSNHRPLMEGHRVWISPSIKPSVEEVKILIESMGGTVIKARPTARSGDDVLCIVNEDDTKTARNLSEMGLSVYTTELVYSAILQQKLNLNQNLVK